MSALLQSHPIPTHRPRLYVVPSLVDSTSFQRVSPEVYRRRRVAALALVVLSVITLWAIAQSFTGVLAGSQASEPMQTISATKPIAPVEGDVYWTVRPGDTLWSIAQAVHPKGDIRPMLKRLDDRYGSTPLVAGQNILVS